MDYLIIDAKDIRKNAGIVVFTLKQGSRKVTENLIRTSEQYKLDLENSDLDLDVHPSKLIGATVIGNIEEVAAGSTYVLDANASLVKNGATVPTVVGRIVNGVPTKVDLLAGQKGIIGDIAIRTKGATRLVDGFATFLLSRAQHDAIAYNSKSVRASNAAAFAAALTMGVPQAMPEVVESAKEVVATTSANEMDDIFNALLGMPPVADAPIADKIEEPVADALVPEVAAAIDEVNDAIANASKATKAK